MRLHDYDFQSELETEARLDELSEMEQLAIERGFETIEEMNEYDREQELQRSDYYQGVL